ncbi:MAG: DUF190 domain-containing protein [Pseudomonadota bacterium]
MSDGLQTFAKKKLEITVEAPLMKRLLGLLDRMEVNGYTVVPALAGRGREGSWQRDGLVSTAGQMVVVTCILDAGRESAVLKAVYDLIARQIGIVTVSDVLVVRPEHF